jgi:hypothetical protein
MSNAPHRLRLVPPREVAPAPEGTPEDLLLLAAILAVGSLPIVSTLLGAGHWSRGALGLATVASIFSARELWRLAAARLAARRSP